MQGLTESEMITKARSIGKQIQRQLSAEGDSADWLDCLEMAYNELIIN
jgi:hypothetical protein